VSDLLWKRKERNSGKASGHMGGPAYSSVHGSSARRRFETG
jgi:hypothetical protein